MHNLRCGSKLVEWNWWKCQHGCSAFCDESLYVRRRRESFAVPKLFHTHSLRASTQYPLCGRLLGQQGAWEQQGHCSNPACPQLSVGNFSLLLFQRNRNTPPAFYEIQTSLPYVLSISENGKRIGSCILKLCNSYSTARPSNLVSNSMPAYDTVQLSLGFYSVSWFGFPTSLLHLLSLIFFLTFGSQTAISKPMPSIS